ncbi:MAG: hypothetical protein RIR00_2275 [Pseudomonadota bacterium]|jgi:ubiquinone biosynthesis protein UbiJ
MLLALPFAALNHLLAQSSWAAGRLQAYYGQTLRIELAGMSLLATLEDGPRLSPAAAGSEPAVTLQLPADTPIRLLTDRSSLFSAVRLQGAADFAEALGFVFRNLSWDVEDDLARVVGDVAAHRLVQGGRDLLAWQQRSVENLGHNLAEYVSEEKGYIATRRELDHFCHDVDQLRDDLARLEKRLQRLGG